ncbi:hypothetical protein ACT3UJ_06610 [Halomonas sp. 86]|uniref:hypothetical protein n=1 Tax=unclassified Halomonas TaxID=2609666 RepID=UPI004033B16E
MEAQLQPVEDFEDLPASEPKYATLRRRGIMLARIGVSLCVMGLLVSAVAHIGGWSGYPVGSSMTLAPVLAVVTGSGLTIALFGVKTLWQLKRLKHLVWV